MLYMGYLFQPLIPTLWNKYYCSPLSFQMKKLRHVEVKYVNKGHSVKKAGSRSCVSILCFCLTFSFELVEMLQMYSFLRWMSRKSYGNSVYGWHRKPSCQLLLCFLTSCAWKLTPSIKKDNLCYKKQTFIFFI